MKIKEEVVINASSDKVWEILARDFDGAQNWARSVHHSEATGNPTKPAAPCDGRVCQTSLGDFTERIEHFNEGVKEISYSAKGAKIPFFVKKMLIEWKVHPAGGGSRASMTMNVDLMFPFNILMALPMKMQLGGAAKDAQQDLKFFAETGKPHPKKIEADKKFRQKNPVAAM